LGRQQIILRLARGAPITLVFSQQYFVTASLQGEKPGFFGLARGAPISLVFSQQYFVTASLQGEKPGF
jgi:uncharacterized membrane protein YhdT